MLLKFRLLSLSLIIVFSSLAQTRTIVGRVFNAETQKPIENAHITIVDSDVRTFTNRLGFFQLEINPAEHKELTVEHIGYGGVMLPVPEGDRFQVPLRKEFVMMKPLILQLYPTPGMQISADEAAERKQQEPGIESDASVVGGIDSFYDYMGNAFVALPGIGDNDFNAAFTIDDSGKAVNLFLSDSALAIKAGVMKVFDSMPAWTPATQRGRNVAQHFVLPVKRVYVVDVNTDAFRVFNGFFASSYKYPVSAIRMGIEGLSHVEFEIDSLGAVDNINILYAISEDVGSEIRRVLAALPPEFGKVMGSPVGTTKFVLPVALTLDLTPRTFLPQYLIKSNGILLNTVNITARGITPGKRRK